jgi:glycosyltransferase involved in cell wall biosynthesis
LRKKLLVVSYHFPPDLAVGAIRPAKYFKYLPAHGWDVSVLTVPEHCHPQIDSEYISPTNRQKVEAIAPWPNLRDAYLALKAIGVPAWNRAGRGSEAASWTPSEFSGYETKRQKLKRYAQSLLIWLPDDKTGWIPRAVSAGIRKIRNSRIDALLTTSPPNSVQLIGLAIKRLTGIPWIVDFRDPWGWEMKPSFVRSSLSDAADAWMERKVVVAADRVVSVTPEMTAMLSARYLELKTDKFLTISNGFDPDDFKIFAGAAKRDRITFTYAGSFYLGRDPELFLRALRELADTGCLNLSDLSIRFIGNCRYLYGKSIEAIVGRLQLGEIVTFIDPVPRKQAIEEMARSHVLLLFAPDQPLQVPAKIFEYMGLGAHILAICGPGASQNLLQGYQKAVVVAPSAMEAMKEAIIESIHRVRAFIATPLAASGSVDYRHSVLAGHLATVLNDTVL